MLMCHVNPYKAPEGQEENSPIARRGRPFKLLAMLVVGGFVGALILEPILGNPIDPQGFVYGGFVGVTVTLLYELIRRKRQRL